MVLRLLYGYLLGLAFKIILLTVISILFIETIHINILIAFLQLPFLWLFIYLVSYFIYKKLDSFYTILILLLILILVFYFFLYEYVLHLLFLVTPFVLDILILELINNLNKKSP